MAQPGWFRLNANSSAALARDKVTAFSCDRLFGFSSIPRCRMATSIFMPLAYYSVLKFFTGLAIAALMVWKLIVASAIRIAASPLAANNHQLRSMR